MVGVGVAEGGGGPPAPGEPYYGEYYPPENYFVPPEMCQHPQQHPPHAHMCSVHGEYGGMPVVTSAAMMPPMMPPVMDEGMRHYMVPHPHHQPHHHPPHHQPHHQPPPPPPPHHQPQHHYGPANGAGGPQYYGGYATPPHFHQMPPHVQHSPPPPVYQKDERTQRLHSKLKQKLERKHTIRNTHNGIEVVSGASTPSLSPRKDMNGRGSGGGSGGASSGAWSEGEGSSAGASVTGDDDTAQALLDMLSTIGTPQVTEVTSTSALVTWNTPIPAGVAPPSAELNYDLLLGERGRNGYKLIYSGPSLSCRVRDLSPGTEYSVCLRVCAGDVAGAPSDVVTFRAPAAPPDAPPPPRALQRARTSLLLRWAAANDNGARILHYLLEMDAGEGFHEVTRPRKGSYTVNGLRTQTRYRFRIAAVNEVGRSEWSEEALVWTCGAPPSAPAPPSLARADANALVLAWERRQDEEFTLQMDDAARGHGFLPVYSGPECSYRCSGLRRSTDYRFRLRAETPDGQGPWSGEVTYRTLPERPAVPGRPAARGKVHSRAFRLRWEPPAEDGGAPIDTYTLELDDGDGYRCAYEGRDREAHCERLRPGTPYRARVRCANVAGHSDWSPTETVGTECAVPTAPAAPLHAAEPRATLAAVRWRAPDCTGGAPLTEYRLTLADLAGSERLAYSGLGTECTVRDLRPGETYSLWVTAVNRVGAGPPSAALAFRTAPAPPDAPPDLGAAVMGARDVSLQWMAPRDNGAPVLDYRLEMSAAGATDAFAEVWRGGDTQCAVVELTPFTPYMFRVCATNAAGRGAWSVVRDALTQRAPPAAPAGLRHEGTDDALRLCWRAPADHGAPVLRYRVRLDDTEHETEDARTEHTLAGLAPDTTYRVRVAALSELGVGAWSEEVRAATRPPPPTAPPLRAHPPQHTHLKLDWPALPEGTHYCVEMRATDSKDFRSVYRGSARSCKVKKLREATTYEFRIRATDERGGRGEWGPVVTVRTPAAPPPAPRAPAVQPAAAQRAVAITWDGVEDTTYHLQCARSKDNVYKTVYEGPETQYQLEDLEYGGEYLLRVCYVRGGLNGAWSPSTRLVMPPAPAAARPKARRATKRLTPTQTALLMAGGFLVVAVIVAVLVQRLVEPRP